MFEFGQNSKQIVRMVAIFKMSAKTHQNFKVLQFQRKLIQLTRYLEFDGTMGKIWVNRSSTQEELRKYRKFWRAKTSNVPILGTILSLFDVFVVFFPFYYNC